MLEAGSGFMTGYKAAMRDMRKLIAKIEIEYPGRSQVIVRQHVRDLRTRKFLKPLR